MHCSGAAEAEGQADREGTTGGHLCVVGLDSIFEQNFSKWEIFSRKRSVPPWSGSRLSELLRVLYAAWNSRGKPHRVRLHRRVHRKDAIC